MVKSQTKFTKKKAQQKQIDDDPSFQDELNEAIEEEEQRREDAHLEPLDDEGKKKIESKLKESREKAKVHDRMYPKYFVGQGNNYQVIKNAIKSRYWWNQAHSEDFAEANFIWTSWKKDRHI